MVTQCLSCWRKRWSTYRGAATSAVGQAGGDLSHVRRSPVSEAMESTTIGTPQRSATTQGETVTSVRVVPLTPRMKKRNRFALTRQDAPAPRDRRPHPWPILPLGSLSLALSLSLSLSLSLFSTKNATAPRGKVLQITPPNLARRQHTAAPRARPPRPPSLAAAARTRSHWPPPRWPK